jgi:predicted PurR-regulated permease PerM
MDSDLLIPPPEKEPTVFDRIVTTQRALQGLLIIAVLYTLYFARSFFLPIFIGLLIAAFLQPLVDRITRIKIPRLFAAAIVLLAFAAAVLFAMYELSTPAAQWLNRGPAAFKELEQKLSAIKKSVKNVQEKAEKLEQVTDVAPSGGSQVVVKSPSLGARIVGHASSVAASTAVTFIFIFFLLARGPSLLARLEKGLHESGQGERLADLLLRLQKEISYYLRTITIINLSLGATVGVAMHLVGLPSPALWAVVSAVLNFVPYIGPAVTFGIICVVSLLTFDTWTRILMPPIVYFVLRTLEGEVITPLILGHRLDIHPIIIFLAILFWGWVWGIPGVFLAIPTLVTLRVLSMNIELMKPLRRVLE